MFVLCVSTTGAMGLSVGYEYGILLIFLILTPDRLYLKILHNSHYFSQYIYYLGAHLIEKCVHIANLNA